MNRHYITVQEWNPAKLCVNEAFVVYFIFPLKKDKYEFDPEMWVSEFDRQQ